jgi:hypothetical protein
MGERAGENYYREATERFNIFFAHIFMASLSRALPRRNYTSFTFIKVKHAAVKIPISVTHTYFMMMKPCTLERSHFVSDETITAHLRRAKHRHYKFKDNFPSQ